MMAEHGLDDISETIGNLVVPETQQGSINSTSHNAQDEDEISSSTGPNIVTLPAYSAWLKRADQFQLDPIFQKEDISLVHFNSVDPKASFVKLKETDITPVDRGWGKCLLGRFAGRFPGREVVYGLMKRWPCKARVTFHCRGWMIFQFGSEDEMESTRQKGPFDAFGMPLVLQSMPAKFDPDMEPEVRVPVWLRLVDLPLELWNLTAVSKIGSYLGTPLSTDYKTLRRESMDGPRIQVIINTTQRPRDAVSVELPSGDFIDVKLEYEFLPTYCPACKNFGHL